jgi:hypothetical protein
MKGHSLGENNARLLTILGSEDFYFRLHNKPLTKRDRSAIKNFISGSIPEVEWCNFEEHCLQNDLDPYQEFREAAVSCYARMLILNAKVKEYANVS